MERGVKAGRRRGMLILTCVHKKLPMQIAALAVLFSLQCLRFWRTAESGGTALLLVTGRKPHVTPVTQNPSHSVLPFLVESTLRWFTSAL